MNTMQSFGMRGAHVFDVRVARSVSTVSHLGEEIGRTRTGAIYWASRWLLDSGLAEPHHRVVTMIDGMLSMSGYVGSCARWRVTEEDKAGLRLISFAESDIVQRETVDV